MNPQEFIKRLGELDIFLEVRGEDLCVRGKRERLTSKQMQEIRDRKASIITTLKNQDPSDSKSMDLRGCDSDAKNLIELNPQEFENVVQVFRTLFSWKTSNTP
jgi:hypothetical protein